MSIQHLGAWLRNDRYEGKRKLILLSVADCVNPEGVGFVSYQQIQEHHRVSRQHVVTCMKDFIADGVLSIVEPPRRGRATVYRLLLPEVKDGGNRTEVKDGGQSCGLDLIAAGLDPIGVSDLTPLDAPLDPIDDDVASLDVKSLDPNDPGTWPIPIPPSAVPTTFDRFWHMYPRKAGKQAARKAFTKATKHADVEVIIAGAARFASDPNREDSFTPHPATWLNQGRWEDDPLPPRTSSGGSGKESTSAALARIARSMEAG